MTLATLTIATYLTLLRIIVILPMVVFLWLDSDWARWGALSLYTFACITDFFDGWLARKRKEVTNLGKFLDPIADKLLIAAVILMLVANERIEGVHVLATIIILMREIAVSGLREHLAGLQIQMPVSTLAKWKTTAQMIALGFLILGDVTFMPFFLQSFIAYIGFMGNIMLIGEILLWIAALLTLYTGWYYLQAGIKNID